MIVKSFRVYGISAAVDGTEDKEIISVKLGEVAAEACDAFYPHLIYCHSILLRMAFIWLTICKYAQRLFNSSYRENMYERKYWVKV